eukprot:3272101-Ditylum_brightwellii.AAC.1
MHGETKDGPQVRHRMGSLVGTNHRDGAWVGHGMGPPVGRETKGRTGVGRGTGTTVGAELGETELRMDKGWEHQLAQVRWEGIQVGQGMGTLVGAGVEGAGLGLDT